jgi:hypothetical protein
MMTDTVTFDLTGGRIEPNEKTKQAAYERIAIQNLVAKESYPNQNTTIVRAFKLPSGSVHVDLRVTEQGAYGLKERGVAKTYSAWEVGETAKKIRAVNDTSNVILREGD